MSNVIKGAVIAEQARELAWRRDSGYAQVFRMRGLKDWIYNQLPFWQTTADEVRIVEDNSPYATLIAQINSVLDGRVEEPVNVWELLGQDLHHDLYEHPMAANLSADNIRLIRKAVDENRRGAESTVGLGPGSISEKMFKLLVKGTDSYTQAQYVLRKTQSVTSRYSLLMNMINVDAIWSLAQIYSVETVFNVIVDAINRIPAPVAKPGFVWGWLKKPASITAEANNKVRATQEWWLEQWSSDIYPSLF